MGSHNLPLNWSWIKLGDVCKKIHYGYTASSVEKEIGPKLLRITDIQNGKVNWEEVPFCEIDETEISKYLLQENDIVFARTGATVGKSFLIKGIIPKSVFASYLIRVILGEKALPLFVFYFFQSNDYWRQIKESSAGIGQPNVNAIKLSNIIFPLPSLPEQYRIVNKLEELFSELDKGVENLRKAKEQIKTYRQSVLAAAFSGELTEDVKRKKRDGELPEGWKWVKLGDEFEIVTGTTPSKKEKKFYGMDFPFFKPTDLNAGINVFQSADNLTKIGMQEARLLPIGSVLVTCIGATIGKTGLIKTSGASNQQINSLIYNENNNSKYVYYFCISDVFQKQIRENASSTTLPIINKSKFEKLYYLKIPTSDQDIIVDEIERRFSVADKLEQTIDEGLKKAEMLKQSILKQAFEGKLIKGEKKEKELTLFQLMQVVGTIINNLEEYNIHKGEMIIAKYLYLLQKLYRIKIGLKYERLHFGPYVPKLKKLLTSPQGFFQKIGNGTTSYYAIKKKEQLFKYHNNLIAEVNEHFPKLIELFAKAKNSAKRDHKIELLATVSKIIEDFKTLDHDSVYERMKEWKTDKEITGYNNKAEKFAKDETIRCIEFIKKNEWDKELLGDVI